MLRSTRFSVATASAGVAILTIAGLPAVADAPKGLQDDGAIDNSLVPDEIESGEQAANLYPSFEKLSVLDGFQDGGFLEGTDELLYYWHGDLSPGAQAVIDEIRALGQIVHVEYTPYTVEEMFALADHVAQLLERDGIVLNGWGGNIANDGIEVLGPEVSIDPELQQQATQVARAVLPYDVSITFLPDEGNPVNFAARHDDTAVPTIGGDVRAGFGGGFMSF